MPVVVGGNRLFRFAFEADGAALTLRGFTADERSEFDKLWIQQSNRPDPKGLAKADIAVRNVGRRRAILRDQAAKLLASWEGFVDDAGKPFDLTAAAKEKFFGDPEMRKYWEPAISAYLWPLGGQAERDPDEEDVSFRPGP